MWQKPVAAVSGAPILGLELEPVAEVWFAVQTRFALYPFVKVGKRVRIRGWCLHGVECLLTRRNQGKLVIPVESIQRSLGIEIRGYEVEMA